MDIKSVMLLFMVVGTLGGLYSFVVLIMTRPSDYTTREQLNYWFGTVVIKKYKAHIPFLGAGVCALISFILLFFIR